MSDPRITSGDPLAGYTTPPPPGAGGVATADPLSAPASAGWELSGWWRRVGAYLIDAVVIVIIAGVFFGIFAAFAGAGFLVGDTTGFIASVLALMGFLLCVVVAALLYAPLMMARTNGKTLGRMMTGIRVVRANGKPISFGYAVVREVLVKWLLIGAIAGSFTFGLAVLIDYLWPLWDEENRALHDMVVDSRTILD
ncbi:RDD family protein [Solirubrobacter ginsenosidimutans]|uniref:RDD family protein n=1 Tax=Solirubrobacter ginsenosidimutans TaxID=490573 RepID=A0A9X3MYY4_9ACTN|nr:RDD family protein [Solirubrobacter ginsenosidimutans]MDA0162053.1 RDD family protein [Solirubrobacter ginsenosidimutans]